MKLHAKKLIAKFSAVLNHWEIDLGEFKFWIHYLGVKGCENIKMKYQIVEAEDADFELIGEWLILNEWSKIHKEHLYTPYNPDTPKNLAKSVTVT